jgi:hypothetical protein
MTQPRMTRLEFDNRLRLYLAGTMGKNATAYCSNYR